MWCTFYMLEQHQWKHFGTPYDNFKTEKRCLSGWNHGEGHSQRCNTYFLIQFNNLLTLPRQDNTPSIKLIQGLWENPWHRVCWEIGKVQICLSVLILNYWTSPKFSLLFLLFFFFFHPAWGHKFNAVTTSIAVQWGQSCCANWMSETTFLSWSVFLLRFFFFFFGWMTAKMLRTITHFNINVDSHLSLRHKDCPDTFLCVLSVLLFNVYEQVNWLAYSHWIVNSSSNFSLFLLASLL